MGVLFRAAFSWARSVREPVEQLLSNTRGDVKIGLHARHQWMDEVRRQREDERAISCIAQLARNASMGSCVVLVASDREETVADVRENTLTEDRRLGPAIGLERSRLERARFFHTIRQRS